MHDPWWMPGWQALCDKYADQGYDALSAPEKVWLNVRTLIDETENGGLIAFFYNSGADTLPDCLAALDTLAASGVRRQVERVVALFPGGVPKTMDERNAAIESWNEDETEELLDEVDEELFSLFEKLEKTLDRYVRKQGLVASSA